MTRTANELITSDGTATLRFRDPNTFQETRQIVVKDGSKIINQLNELEFIKGEIYANVWHSEMIARISPRDGHVIAWIDLTGLEPASQKVDPEAVLNGIAYDSKNDRIFVTGKRWPTIFEIRIVPRATAGKRHALNSNSKARGSSPVYNAEKGLSRLLSESEFSISKFGLHDDD